MITTTQAFEKFRQRLELSDTEQKDAVKAPEGRAGVHPRRSRGKNRFSFGVIQAPHENEALEGC